MAGRPRAQTEMPTAAELESTEDSDEDMPAEGVPAEVRPRALRMARVRSAPAAVTTCCAICLEDVETGITLPCNCKVPYCGPCWDRSLASGLHACGLARCPTCRCVIRADFDSTTGKVVFSAAPEDSESDDDDMGIEDSIPAEVLAALAAETRAAGAASASAIAGAATMATTTSLGSMGEGPPPQPLPASQIEAATASAPPTAAAASQAQPSIQRRRSSQGLGPIRMIERLVEQARPAQIRLLRQVGDADPGLRSAAAGAVKARETLALSAVAEWSSGGEARRRELRGEQVRVEGLLNSVSGRAAEAPKQPACVCGNQLAHVSYRERVRRYMRMRLPSLAAGSSELDRQVDAHLERGEACYYCDICGESRAEGGVWTCESGNSTVLHANAYDVCEFCFAVYCAGTAEEGL